MNVAFGAMDGYNYKKLNVEMYRKRYGFKNYKKGYVDSYQIKFQEHPGSH